MSRGCVSQSTSSLRLAQSSSLREGDTILKRSTCAKEKEDALNVLYVVPKLTNGVLGLRKKDFTLGVSGLVWVRLRGSGLLSHVYTM